jgi:Tfp pilus assembly protein PilF
MRFSEQLRATRISSTAILLAIVLVVSTPSLAQTPPTSTPTPTKGGGTPGANPPEPRSTEPTNTGGGRIRQSIDQRPGLERPVFLSGRVMMASGGVPSEPIRIRRKCGVQLITVGFTDTKGRFSFPAAGSFGITADASSKGSGIGSRQASITGSGMTGYGNLNSVDLTGCSLSADAPGFQSNTILLSRYRSMDRNDIGIIILTPRGGVQGSIVSATSLAAPKKARVSFDKGMKELQKGDEMNSGKTMQALEEAVKIYPEYAAAWTFLGQVRLQAGDAGGARAAFEKAVEADPQYARPFEPLARIAASQNDWSRVYEVTSLALRAAPGDMQMRWFRAVSQFELKDHDDAIDSLSSLQSDEASARQYPQTHHVLGMIYAERGQYADAADEYRRYLELVPTAPVGDDLKRRIYEWEQLGVL